MHFGLVEWFPSLCFFWKNICLGASLTTLRWPVLSFRMTVEHSSSLTCSVSASNWVYAGFATNLNTCYFRITLPSFQCRPFPLSKKERHRIAACKTLEDGQGHGFSFPESLDDDTDVNASELALPCTKPTCMFPAGHVPRKWRNFLTKMTITPVSTAWTRHVTLPFR